MQAHDLLAVEVVGEPRLSPDGNSVLYTVTRLDTEHNGYTSDLWLVPVAGGAARRLFAGSGDRVRRPAWSPDSRAIAFISDRDGRSQVWALVPADGEARQITHGGDVTDLCWSADGRFIAYCAQPPGADPGTAKIREYTRFPIAYDGLGQLEPEGPALYVVPVAGGQPRLMAGGPYTHRTPAYSPDGRWLACTRVEHFNVYRDGGGEIWLLPGEGGEGRAVAGGVGFHQSSAMAWCPDNRHLLYISSHMQVTGRKPDLMRASTAGDAPVSLTRGFDRFVGFGGSGDLRFGAGSHPVAADARYGYFVAGDGGNVPLWRVPLSGDGPVEQVTPRIRHCVAEFSLGPGGRIVYTAMDDRRPDQVFYLDGNGEPRQLTAIGEDFWSRADPMPMERFTVQCPGGSTAEAWITRPRGATGAVPAILHIHGGPHSEFDYMLDFRQALWGSRGWAVIQANPPGSSGYGDAFARAVRGDWGGQDYDYQMAVVDHCLAQGWVRADRLAVTGTSYGGYMTNTIITRTERFRCAVTENGVSNLYSNAGTSDYGILLAQGHSEGKAPWEDPLNYLQRSPVHHARRIRTPLLVNHAEGDARVPIGQGIELYAALQRLGQEVVLVRYPHDSHFMSWNGRPSNRLHLLERQVAWFHRFLDVP